jgi:hypothetical protein
MKLTGKCKEDFEKWFRRINLKNNWLLNSFYKLPQSMQYGVLIDFFDSVGIKIHLDRNCQGIKFNSWFITITKENGMHLNNFLKDTLEKDSRPEARDAAIEKANELYNL